MFHIAAGSHIVKTGFPTAGSAHLTAFKLHLAEQGRREVRIIHTRSDRIVRKYAKVTNK